MKRRGYTLFELVLVLALVVVAASLAFPIADSLLNPNRVNAASDCIRAQWAEMRGRAMSEGRAYRCMAIDKGGKFRIEPDDADPGATSSDGWVFEGELPEDVVMVKDEGTLMAATAPLIPGSEYELVAVYLPDGTARNDVLLSFGLPGLRPLTLQIRSLTGAVSFYDPDNPSGVQR
ncbi:MAG: prepilin-type N-terminal cleavage/methylation domain-containing protein [Planctomycetes bacterium]|nr:prepilin-type N-terminal cleavage/methylation domain-containing protein [Planctomycetota bacterium]